MVQVMQRDALERLDLNQMLLQPELLESFQPDIHLVTTLLTLNKAMPDQTRETARMIVRKVVEELEKKLNQPLREAIRGALSRAVRNRRPKMNEMDWDKTIRANLKHYQPTLKTIIPETLIGRGRRGQGTESLRRRLGASPIIRRVGSHGHGRGGLGSVRQLRPAGERRHRRSRADLQPEVHRAAHVGTALAQRHRREQRAGERDQRADHPAAELAQRRAHAGPAHGH